VFFADFGKYAVFVRCSVAYIYVRTATGIHVSESLCFINDLLQNQEFFISEVVAASYLLLGADSVVP